MSIERIVVSIIAALFQSFAVTLISFKQLPKCEIKKSYIFFGLLWFYCIIGFLFIPNQLRFILFITILALEIFFILGMKSKDVILYAFNTEVIMSISEIIISFILVLVGIDSVDIVNNSKYNLLTNILISLFSILLIYIPFINATINKIIKIFNKNKNLINYLYIFLVILYLVVSKNGLEFILKSNYYINILFMFSIVFIIVLILKSEFKYDKLKDENKLMLSYVTKYEKIITEKGKANHEFKNQLMVIRGYAQMNKPDKLLEYIDGVVEDSKKTGSSYLISQLNNFPDGGIKGLLYYKLSLMDDFKIKYEINVEEGVKDKLDSLNTAMYNNITKILGVLLDNAIDASRQTRKKKIIITVSKERTNVIFNLYNTYKGKLDISKIGTGYTTKGKNHGYGLRLVKDIVESNKNLCVEKFLEEDYYVSKLIIKIPKKGKKIKGYTK